ASSRCIDEECGWTGLVSSARSSSPAAPEQKKGQTAAKQHECRRLRYGQGEVRPDNVLDQPRIGRRTDREAADAVHVFRVGVDSGREVDAPDPQPERNPYVATKQGRRARAAE